MMRRHTVRRGRNLRGTLIAAAAAAAGVATLAASRADAGLMLDLRAVGVNGQPLPPGADAKHVVVGPGDTLQLKLYAVVIGTNGVNDEQVKSTMKRLMTFG